MIFMFYANRSKSDKFYANGSMSCEFYANGSVSGKFYAMLKARQLSFRSCWYGNGYGSEARGILLCYLQHENTKLEPQDVRTYLKMQH